MERTRLEEKMTPKNASKSVLVIGNKACVGMDRLVQLAALLNASQVHLLCHHNDNNLPVRRHFFASILRGDESSPKTLEKALAVTKASLVILPVAEHALEMRDTTRQALAQVLQKPEFARIQVLAFSQTSTAVISYEKAKVVRPNKMEKQTTKTKHPSHKATVTTTRTSAPSAKVVSKKPPPRDNRRNSRLVSI